MSEQAYTMHVRANDAKHAAVVAEDILARRGLVAVQMGDFEQVGSDRLHGQYLWCAEVVTEREEA